MSDLNAAMSKYNEFLGTEGGALVDSIGVGAAKAALHSAFPNDFEYYMCALELVKYDGSTIDYFVFPINPSSYQQNNPKSPNIEKTMGGVVVSGNSTFVPIDITISGNFGRRFKILVGKDPDVSVAQYSTTTGSFLKESLKPDNRGKFRRVIMNTRVKTGYGATKILESICDKSHGEIDGKPNQLYLYNPAFGANYLVKVRNFGVNQNQGSNMIWNYDLRLTAIAPLEVVIGAKELKRSLASSLGRNIVQTAATSAVNMGLNIGTRETNNSINNAIRT